MEKNTFFAILLSMAVLIFWWMFFQPKARQQMPQAPASKAEQTIDLKNLPENKNVSKGSLLENLLIPEKEIVIQTKTSKIVLTNRGAAVKGWFIKEKNGVLTDLVFDKESSVLSTFPGSNYVVTQNDPDRVTFSHTSPLGWKVTKTYSFSDSYIHNIKIEVEKIKKKAELPYISLVWGPGLGTDKKEKGENQKLTRALGLELTKPVKLDNLKPGEYSNSDYRWVAIDNRYFLAAFIKGAKDGFSKAEVFKEDKSRPVGITLSSTPKTDAQREEFSQDFYVGPKDYSKLKAMNLGLEESVDFGMFGFLGKAVLYSLNYINKFTNNFGWSIIILTIIMQLIVSPLTLKSFKASAAMKQLQPHIKEIQEKFKSDPKRLNAEILNLYKTQKVNPLGGCLPMLLQLPIFWAFLQP